jgi:trimethylamine-N-oxide reductase (cytochrome c)
VNVKILKETLDANNSDVSRRDFVRIVTVVASSVAIQSLIPRGETLLRPVSTEQAAELQQASDQEQTFLRCLSWCGAAMGANPCAVDIKNGRIVRIRPLHYDWRYKPSDFNYDSWKVEVGGQVFQAPLKALVPPLSIAYKKRAYSPNRVKYPLKRVDWDPSGNRNPQNRGKSGFVRISWDEALSTIVNEINRIKTDYGTSAILTQADFHGEGKTIHGRPGALKRLLNLIGPTTTQARNPDSWEGYYWGATHVWGMDQDMACGTLFPQGNNWLDMMRNSELVIEIGDAETTPGMFQGCMQSLMCYWLKQAGKHVIYICPDLNYAAAVHADKWIPVLPNTDVALWLAIAYTWITEGTYDKDYVATHTIGFDEEMLPDGAPANSSFKSYVMGLAEDGVPKTPKWAEGICGVPARTIKALAREWASKKTTLHHGTLGGSYMRGPYSTEPARMGVLLLAMQGLGRPGVTQVIGSGSAGALGPRGKIAPSTMAAFGGLMFAAVPEQPFIAKCHVPGAILNPPVSYYGAGGIGAPREDQYVKYTWPPAGYSKIHMIWSETPCLTACWNEGNKWIEAYRSSGIEFYLVQHPWLENDCLYADIVLPVTTNLENDTDILADGMSNNGIFVLMLQNQCINPIGESHSDVEVCEMLAAKLGLLEKFTGGRSHQDLVQFGYQTSGVADLISWDDLQSKQYYVVPMDPEWASVPPGFQYYWEMPEGQGLHTPSGKIEFYSIGLAEHFPDDKERPPVPHWIPYGPTHQESLQSPRAKQYPLLLVSNHPRWRCHVQGDDVSWLREIETCKVRGPDGYQYEPIWIHPTDAGKRGIKQGDILEMYNDRGAVLGGAYVTERIRPGAVYQDHGAKVDMITDRLDRSGENNLISPYHTVSANAQGMATSGYLVEVKKADMQALMTKYPDAFKRPLDYAAGLVYDSWVKG